MGLELNFHIDLLVTRSEIETHGFHYDGRSRDVVTVVLEVVSHVTPENDRKVNGEIYLTAEAGDMPSDYEGDYHGSWIFYTTERFRADIALPVVLLERLWRVCAAKPLWLFFTIEEGPELQMVGKEAEGLFRVRYRAGNVRDVKAPYG